MDIYTVFDQIAYFSFVLFIAAELASRNYELISPLVGGTIAVFFVLLIAFIVLIFFYRVVLRKEYVSSKWIKSAHYHNVNTTVILCVIVP